ncbi:MAG: hypothetical protein OHK0039_32290 [Bacteroidia bacterium]
MRMINPHRKTVGTSQTKARTGPLRGLSVRKVDDYLRFSAFIVLIGMFYIWNSYRAETRVKLMEEYKKEVKDLKSRYLLQRATLDAGLRFAELRDKLDTLGLRPLSEPAYKVVSGLEVPLSKLEVPKINPGQRFEEIPPAPTDTLPPATCPADSTAVAMTRSD